MMLAAASTSEAVLMTLGMFTMVIAGMVGFVWCIHFVTPVYSLWEDVTRLQKEVDKLTSDRDKADQ